ncbi:hypothetical protein NYP20_13305 [Pseudomonas sp. N3-W]|uniref:Secretion protein n=1 Tax=Pseudomonas fungipugnans TaxID=3024217 RepID=A0ABT6QHQ9_9PSED|nr:MULTISPECIES: hypothetical protein [unclassified Pseudomonas]MDI2590420.1 hypothetical protein [Pseudomonas sp. 681]UWF51879.1 hypothetical protein NYP20_13305 [Pseudomonas sp. N3-W]
MPALQSIDPVTQFLKSQGLQPEVAYFEKSEFVMGWQVQLGDFELVYRFEDSTLTVCNFTAIESAKGTSGAVSQFISLIHRIERYVKELSSVRGRFIDSVANSQINQVRERLAKVLVAQGASWEEVEGESWLVYPLASKTTQAS